MLDIETIRKAIEKFHGIRKDTPEDQVKRIWDSLSPEIQQMYLKKVTPKERKGKDAVSDTSKRHV